MRIIISPAKKMKADPDSLPYHQLPAFLPQAQTLARRLQELSYDSLKALWKCNDQIAALNVKRLQEMDFYSCLTPALLAYDGIQFRYMAPGVFDREEYEYLQEHLRILSGLYGILRPFDGIVPYRLEMQAKLSVGQDADLYAFWGDRLAQSLCGETDCIVNLASREYSLCVSKYLPDSVRFITCVFGEEKGGKIIEKGTMCKMARGEMVRFLAEHQITDANGLPLFDRLHYRFAPACSDERTFVFIRQEA